VGAEFFSTLGVHVIAGRDFIAGDGEAGAAIIDERAAEALWPGESPIGHVLKLGDGRSTRPWLRVVGLVPRITLQLNSDPDLPSEPGVYVTQQSSNNIGEVIVRSDTPAITAAMLRRMIRQTFPKSIGWSHVEIWSNSFDSVLSSRQFMAGLFIVFAGFTLLLALAGLYGTLSYAVTRRMREFAVRGALGATDADLRRLMWSQMMVAILAGTAIGGPAGMWAAKSLDAWTYDVFYADAGILLMAEGILIGTALLACLGPARRAGRVDVSRVLREL
jgi:ABC-type antimicrobial peptide transport system permease subunit